MEPSPCLAKHGDPHMSGRVSVAWVSTEGELWADQADRLTSVSLHTLAVRNARFPRRASPTRVVCPHLPPGADSSSDGGHGCQLPLSQARASGEISVHPVRHDATKVRMRMVANE